MRSSPQPEHHETDPLPRKQHSIQHSSIRKNIKKTVEEIRAAHCGGTSCTSLELCQLVTALECVLSATAASRCPNIEHNNLPPTEASNPLLLQNALAHIVQSCRCQGDRWSLRSIVGSKEDRVDQFFNLKVRPRWFLHSFLFPSMPSCGHQTAISYPGPCTWSSQSGRSSDKTQDLTCVFLTCLFHYPPPRSTWYACYLALLERHLEQNSYIQKRISHVRQFSAYASSHKYLQLIVSDPVARCAPLHNSTARGGLHLQSPSRVDVVQVRAKHTPGTLLRIIILSDRRPFR